MLQRVRVVLLVGGIFGRAVVLPYDVALQVADGEVGAAPRSFGSLDEFADVGIAAVDLAAHAVHMNAVVVFEIYAEIVVLIPRHAALAASESGGSFRLITREPVEYVDIVNVLFNDMVSGKPFPVHPVADHPLHVRPTFFTVAVPQHRLIPVDVAAGNFADQTFLHLFIRFYVGALMVTLRSGDNAQPLGLGLLGRGHYGAVTFRIDADRFFEETVYPFFGGVFEVFRTEKRGRGDDYHVYAGIDHVFIGVETGEAFVVGYFDLVFVFQRVFQSLQAVVEYVTKRRDRNSVGGRQKVLGRSRTASAAADHAGFQFFSVGRFVGQFRNVIFRLFAVSARGKKR